jgi:hypothetical protein
MKCGECGKVAKCSAVPAVGEDGRTTLLYLCKPCKREYIEDQAASEGEG